MSPRATVDVTVGDVLAADADVLVSPANVQLNLSGGVNGEILRRGGEAIQRELHEHLARRGKPFVEPGTVVVSSAAPLAFRAIVHAVAIDAFYTTTRAMLTLTISRALAAAAELGETVAMPALATGYGRVPIADFAAALRDALDTTTTQPARLRVVVRTAADADAIRTALA